MLLLGFHDDVEEERDESETEELVDERESEEALIGGEDIPETDRRNRHEDEVKRFQEVPVLLPRSVHSHASPDVRPRQEERRAEGEVVFAVDDEDVTSSAPRTVEGHVERLEAESEKLSQFSQNDETERDADQCVRHRCYATRLRCRVDVPVTCQKQVDNKRISREYSCLKVEYSPMVV